MFENSFAPHSLAHRERLLRSQGRVKGMQTTMSTSSFDEKIRSVFGEFAIDKGLVRRLGGCWRRPACAVVRHGLDRDAQRQAATVHGAIEKAVQEFIAKHLPAKGEKKPSVSSFPRARR